MSQLTSVAAEFIHLQQDVGDDNHLVTRALDVTSSAGEALLIALNREGLKHLLIPVSSEERILQDKRSRGVWLMEMVLGPVGQTRRFACLQCREPSLDLVFERLVEDVVHRIGQGEPTERACHIALDDWRAMLKAAGGVGREEIIGLIGELHILSIIGRSSAAEALQAWTGPRRTIHDFVHQGAAIEVKATAAVDGAAVNINGLDQLDPAEVASLHLAVVHCQMDPTVATLDDRIRRLIYLGYPRDELLAAVERTGYVFESVISQPTTFKIRSLRLWKVGDNFPGLRRSVLPEDMRRGVTGVNYTLSVDAAPGALTDQDAHAFLEGWLSS